LLSEGVFVQSVTWRVKDRSESISKFKRKYHKELEENGKEYEIREYITDLIGLRIVCLYNRDIARVKSALADNFEVIDITDKIQDMDRTENEFGYKSLHLDLMLNSARKKLPENKQYSSLRFEVQIRTIIQDAWCVLDHKIKYKKQIPDDLKRRINRLAALFELADDEFYSIKLDTENFEKTAKSDSAKENQILNIFSFIDLSQEYFKGYNFIEDRADAFVHELLTLKHSFTKEDLNAAIKNNIELVRQFNSYVVYESPSHYLNPYTMIRHCLYLYDQNAFNEMLFDVQRRSFEEWLKQERN